MENNSFEVYSKIRTYLEKEILKEVSRVNLEKEMEIGVGISCFTSDLYVNLNRLYDSANNFSFIILFHSNGTEVRFYVKDRVNIRCNTVWDLNKEERYMVARVQDKIQKIISNKYWMKPKMLLELMVTKI